MQLVIKIKAKILAKIQAGPASEPESGLKSRPKSRLKSGPKSGPKSKPRLVFGPFFALSSTYQNCPLLLLLVLLLLTIDYKDHSFSKALRSKILSDMITLQIPFYVLIWYAVVGCVEL